MKSQNDKPKVISTFSGCGGSSYGYHLAGYDVLLAVEMDNHAVATYKANFPNTTVYHGDIHNLTVDDVLKTTGLKKGELDLFDGSPPCQGFSMAGNREFCDPKNQLYNEYIRLLRGLQPKTFVMENVKGLVSGDMKLIFKDIYTQLKNSGYDVVAKLMNAQYYNCATSRERLIITGVREDLNIPASLPKPQTRPLTIRECLKNYKTKYHSSVSNPKVIRLLKRSEPGDSLSKYHRNGSYFNYHNLDPNKPCVTICKTGYKQYFIDGRVFEVDEASRCQSFPEDFKWIGTPNQQWARIGNSVPPNLMKAISLHIKENVLDKIEK